MGLHLLFLSNFPRATFIQGGTFIPESRVSTIPDPSDHIFHETFIDAISEWNFLFQITVSAARCPMEKGPLSVISVISVLAISAQCSAQNSNSKTKKNSIVVLHYHFFRSIAMRLRPGEFSKFSYMSLVETPSLVSLPQAQNDAQ